MGMMGWWELVGAATIGSSFLQGLGDVRHGEQGSNSSQTNSIRSPGQ